ncbi:MAG: N-acetyl-alpha-D-glucosaminyl L-malate synthase BshA [Candidatus Doudnabacteria bacterium]|nr:N-acetyl-alpha-D-glucosaminyl L-malate synthase BshA [Candidatus Doudnabacteria bacterium]
MLKIRDKRLRIGIVCYPSIGGSGVVATNLGNELARLGHQVHFISYEKPFRLNGSRKNTFFHRVNINKYDLFKYPDYTLPLAVAIGGVHEKYELDILHVHYAVPHATAALLAVAMIEQCSHCSPPKIITTLHGTDITLLARDPNLDEAIKFSIEKSNGVTAVSEYLKEQTRKVLQNRKPIQVIHNFYSPARITNSREEIRGKLGIKHQNFVAIHLSNLRPVKRISDLLKVAAKLKNNKNFKLLILAGGNFKPFLPLVKKLKIEKTVIVRNGEIDTENYLNASDIGLYASEEESFGMGILESMAFGLPVVATRVGGVPEVLNNEKSGFLCRVRDIKNLAAKTKLLIENESLRKKMGAAALLRAQTHFSAEKIVPKYLDYYYKILG